MTAFTDMLSGDLTEVFINPEEFAEPFTYTPKTGTPYEVNCIYDETYNEEQPQGDGFARVQSKYKRVMVKEADIINGGPKVGDEATVRSVDYHVRTSETNGVGLLVLELHKK